MTLSDRLDEIAGKLLATTDYSTFAHAIYQAAIELRTSPEARPAVIEECAQVAEHVVPRHTECGNRIAAAIRALKAECLPQRESP